MTKSRREVFAPTTTSSSCPMTIPERSWANRRPEPGRPEPVYPPEYRSGIGDEGVEALKKFVDEGGTLVTLR